MKIMNNAFCPPGVQPQSRQSLQIQVFVAIHFPKTSTRRSLWQRDHFVQTQVSGSALTDQMQEPSNQTLRLLNQS